MNALTSFGLRRARSIAVGTALSDGPPRRSQRALLTHWAPVLGSGVKALARPGMGDVGRREPAGHEATHPRPTQPRALAAAPERRPPVPDEVETKRRERLAVAGHPVVVEV